MNVPGGLPALQTVSTVGARLAVALDVFAAADEDRTRPDERDELVLVDRQIVDGERPAVADEVSCHPVILADIPEALDLLLGWVRSNWESEKAARREQRPARS